MLAIRSHIAMKVFAAVTAMIFMNMGFFLTEVKLLGLDRGNQALMENIARLIAGSGAEEERDGHADEREDAGKKIDLVFNYSVAPETSSPEALGQRYRTEKSSNVNSGVVRIFSPPPEA